MIVTIASTPTKPRAVATEACAVELPLRCIRDHRECEPGDLSHAHEHLSSWDPLHHPRYD